MTYYLLLVTAHGPLFPEWVQSKLDHGWRLSVQWRLTDRAIALTKSEKEMREYAESAPAAKPGEYHEKAALARAQAASLQELGEEREERERVKAPAAVLGSAGQPITLSDDEDEDKDEDEDMKAAMALSLEGVGKRFLGLTTTTTTTTATTTATTLSGKRPLSLTVEEEDTTEQERIRRIRCARFETHASGVG